jgi:hypothetical protein
VILFCISAQCMYLISFNKTDGLYDRDTILYMMGLIHASSQQDGISTAPGVVRRMFELDPH